MFNPIHVLVVEIGLGMMRGSKRRCDIAQSGKGSLNRLHESLDDFVRIRQVELGIGNGQSIGAKTAKAENVIIIGYHVVNHHGHNQLVFHDRLACRRIIFAFARIRDFMAYQLQPGFIGKLFSHHLFYRI